MICYVVLNYLTAWISNSYFIFLILSLSSSLTHQTRRNLLLLLTVTPFTHFILQIFILFYLCISESHGKTNTQIHGSNLHSLTNSTRFSLTSSSRSRFRTSCITSSPFLCRRPNPFLERYQPNSMQLGRCPMPRQPCRRASSPRRRSLRTTTYRHFFQSNSTPYSQSSFQCSHWFTPFRSRFLCQPQEPLSSAKPSLRPNPSLSL